MTTLVSKLSKAERKRVNALDMREYIQFHLDLYGLGKLVSVVGPEHGGRDNDQSWYQLAIKYRPPGNERLSDVQFYDGRIEVYLGYRNKGGYWNRRNIRIAIEREAQRKRDEAVVKQVWASAQLAITAGPIEL